MARPRRTRTGHAAHPSAHARHAATAGLGDAPRLRVPDHGLFLCAPMTSFPCARRQKARADEAGKPIRINNMPPMGVGFK